jgi:hypothetical protein
MVTMFMRYKDSIELRRINLNRGETLFESTQRKAGIEQQAGFATFDIESIPFAAAG